MKFPTGVTLPVNFSIFSLNVFEKKIDENKGYFIVS
jgi:hypothetical protein